MFIIKRTDQGGGYVAKPGGHSSYTHKLELARVFSTHEEARLERCPANEIVLSIHEAMGY